MERPPAARPEAPRHPGPFLREQVLPRLHLTVSQAARELGVSRSALHRVLAGEAAVSPEMAARLARLCGIAAEHWLARQQTYDLWHVERTLGGVLSRIPCRAPVALPLAGGEGEAHER